MQQVRVSGSDALRATNAADASEWTIYVGKVFEFRAKGTAGVGIYYVPLPNGHLYQHEIDEDTGVGTRRWMIGDGRGSLVGVLDESGGVVERFYVDPWGARIDAAGAPISPVRASGVNVGFTGHEHDEAYGLINMNGRIFDPNARQFLTQDPIVSLFDTQSASSYSYVKNRPYALVDPSGFYDEQNSYSPDGGSTWYTDGNATVTTSYDGRGASGGVSAFDRLPSEPPHHSGGGNPIAGRLGFDGPQVQRGAQSRPQTALDPSHSGTRPLVDTSSTLNRYRARAVRALLAARQNLARAQSGDPEAILRRDMVLAGALGREATNVDREFLMKAVDGMLLVAPTIPLIDMRSNADRSLFPGSDAAWARSGWILDRVPDAPALTITENGSSGLALAIGVNDNFFAEGRSDANRASIVLHEYAHAIGLRGHSRGAMENSFAIQVAISELSDGNALALLWAWQQSSGGP